MKKQVKIIAVIALALSLAFIVGYEVGDFSSKTAEGKPKEPTAYELLQRIGEN